MAVIPHSHSLNKHTVTSSISETSTPATQESSAKPSSWASLFNRTKLGDAVSRTTTAPAAATTTAQPTPPTNVQTATVCSPTNPSTKITLNDLVRNFRAVFRQRPLIARGLVNRGNLCFMNAVLHPLLYTAPLHHFLISVADHVPHRFNSTTPLLDAL
jgi:ubiquitin carboxyl-terminal hydrolase 10